MSDNSEFSQYDIEKLEYEFKKHLDYSKIEELRTQIEKYFINVKHQYPDEKVILELLVELFNKGSKGTINRCIECGIDMGECNPRQYCGKFQCDYM